MFCLWTGGSGISKWGSPGPLIASACADGDGAQGQKGSLIAMDPTTTSRLKAELTALFGAPHEYREFLSWSLDHGSTLEARLYTHCPDPANCELWVVNPARGDPPRRLIALDSPDGVPGAIAALRAYIEEYGGQAPATEKPAGYVPSLGWLPRKGRNR